VSTGEISRALKADQKKFSQVSGTFSISPNSQVSRSEASARYHGMSVRRARRR
jgi:hypothetical protein